MIRSGLYISAGILYKPCCDFLSTSRQGSNFSLSLITDGINFDHSIRWCQTGFSIVKLPFLTLEIINLWGDAMVIHQYIPFLLKLLESIDYSLNQPQWLQNANFLPLLFLLNLLVGVTVLFSEGSFP